MSTNLTKQIIVLIVSVIFFNADAVTYTWTGAVNTAWNNNGNWSPATGFPSAVADIAIFNATANACQLDADHSIMNIQISNTYTGNFDFNGYALTLNLPAANISFDLGAPGAFNLAGAGPGAKIIIMYNNNRNFVPPARALALPDIEIQNLSTTNNRSITQLTNSLICGSFTSIAGPSRRTTYTANKLAFNATSLILDGGWFTGGAAGHDTIAGDVTITSNGGTLTSPTNTTNGWLVINGNYTMNGGTLAHGNGNIRVLGNWSMAAAGATATITSGKIYVGGNWNITAGTFTCGTGTVTFNGDGAANTITTNANNFNILTFNSAAGTGVWTAASAIRSGGLLTMTNGKLDMSTYILTCNAGITATGGILDATSSNVAVTGAVTFGATSTCTFKAPDAAHTFSLTTNFAKSGGTYTHNSGTITFNGTVGGFVTANNPADIYNIAITGTDSLAINSNIKLNNFSMSAAGVLCIGSAKLDTIAGTFSASTGRLVFKANGSLAFANDANLASITGATTTTTAKLVFYNGASVTQKLTQPTVAVTLPMISHTGAGTLQFQNAITSYGLTELGTGTLDFNGKNLTMTSGNFTVSNGTSTTLANMGGITILATLGNVSFNGLSTVTRLLLDGTSNWYVDVPTTRTLTANNCDIGHSYIHATYTNGTAVLSNDLGTNGSTAPKWNFVTTNVWTGTTSTSWNTATNWNLGHVPTNAEDPTFDNTATRDCLLDVTTTVKNISFNSTFARNFSFGNTGNVLTAVGPSVDFSMGPSATTTTSGNGSLALAGIAAQVLIPPPLSSQTLPNITISGGAANPVSVLTNGLYCGVLTLTASAIVFSTSDLVNQVGNISATSGSTMDMGSSNTIRTNGTSASFQYITLTAASTDTFEFNGSSSQTLRSGGTSNVFPNILHSGTATLQLTNNDMKCVSFTQNGGAGCALDLNGRDITTTGDFAITGGNTASFTPATTLNGRTITVAGNASLNGTSLVNYLNLNAASATWTLKVTGGGACDVSYARIAYCNASNSPGIAAYSQDLGNNSNWTFNVNWVSGSPSTWGTAASWSGGQVPTTLGNVTFDGSGGGTGNCQLSASSTAMALNMTSGYAGTFNFNNQSLTISKGADFNSGGTVTTTGGSLIFNSGSYAAAYSFIPISGMSIPTLTKSGSSSITVTTAPITVTSAFTLNSGTWSWGSGLTHTVPSIASSGGTMDFGSSNVRVLTGDAAVSSLSSVTNTSGSLVFLKNGNQTLTSAGSLTLPKIYVSGKGKLILGGNLNCAGLAITMSQFDFSSYSLTVTADAFRVSGGNATTFSNLGGKSISVTGVASFSGTPGNLINLNAAAWNIAVSGSLSASYADIANSNANGAARGKALFGCVDHPGTNTRWDFSQFQPVWRTSGFGEIKAGISTESGTIFLSSKGSPDTLYCINSSDGSAMWAYEASHSGTIGQPEYFFNGTSYCVAFTGGNKLTVLQDDGLKYTQMPYSPITLTGATAGTPFVTPDESAICITSTGHVSKYNASTGASIFNASDQPNIGNAADLVVFSDAIYNATTDGKIEKRDYATGAYIAHWTVPTGVGSASVDNPFDIIDNAAYATTSDGKLYAVDLADLSSTKWSYNLPASVSAPIFTSPNAHGVWVGTGQYLLKISDNGTTTPSVVWTYDAGGGVTVTAAPVVIHRSAGPVYFGSDDGNYMAVHDGTGSNYNMSNWPFASGGTSVITPWVDIFTWKVLFATIEGNLDAFPIDY